MFIEKFNARSQLKEQRKREFVISNSPEHGLEILRLFDELKESYNDIDTKVQGLIADSEKDFLVSYSTHIQGVKRQLMSLQITAGEEESQAKRESKTAALQEEIGWFRDEALRLNNLVALYKGELLEARSKAEGLQAEQCSLEKHLKKLQSQLKGLQDKGLCLLDENNALPSESSICTENSVPVVDKPTSLANNSERKLIRTNRELVALETLRQSRPHNELLESWLDCIRSKEKDMKRTRMTEYELTELLHKFLSEPIVSESLKECTQ